MIINLPLFIFIYIFVVCFLPFYIVSSILVFGNKKRCFYLNYIFTFWLLIYSLFTILLTLTNVDIENNNINFELPNNDKFFSFNFGFSFTFYNFIINFALCFPLGVICFVSFFLNYTKINGKQFVVWFIKKAIIAGLLFGTTIEFLQAVFPTNRVVDICDILFDCLSTIISSFLSYIYFTLSFKQPSHIYI